MTQAQLGEACAELSGASEGWSQSRIANYEAAPDKGASRSPDVDEVPILAAALGAPVQELFGPVAGASQSVGFDVETISLAIKWLRSYIDSDANRPEELMADPDYLLGALNLVASVKAGLPARTATLAFAKRIKAAKEGGGNDKGTDRPVGGDGERHSKRQQRR